MDSFDSKSNAYGIGKLELGAGLILGLLFTGAAAAITWYIVRQIIAVRGQMPFWADEGVTWAIVLLATVIVFMLGGFGISLLCLLLCPKSRSFGVAVDTVKTYVATNAAGDDDEATL